MKPTKEPEPFIKILEAVRLALENKRSDGICELDADVLAELADILAEWIGSAEVGPPQAGGLGLLTGLTASATAPPKKSRGQTQPQDLKIIKQAELLSMKYPNVPEEKILSYLIDGANLPSADRTTHKKRIGRHWKKYMASRMPLTMAEALKRYPAAFWEWLGYK